MARQSGWERGERTSQGIPKERVRVGGIGLHDEDVGARGGASVDEREQGQPGEEREAHGGGPRTRMNPWLDCFMSLESNARGIPKAVFLVRDWYAVRSDGRRRTWTSFWADRRGTRRDL